MATFHPWVNSKIFWTGHCIFKFRNASNQLIVFVPFLPFMQLLQLLPLLLLQPLLPLLYLLSLLQFGPKYN